MTIVHSKFSSRFALFIDDRPHDLPWLVNGILNKRTLLHVALVTAATTAVGVVVLSPQDRADRSNRASSAGRGPSTSSAPVHASPTEPTTPRSAPASSPPSSDQQTPIPVSTTPSAPTSRLSSSPIVANHDLAAPPAVPIAPPTLSPSLVAALRAWRATFSYGGLGIATVYIGLGQDLYCKVFIGSQAPLDDLGQRTKDDLDNLRSKLTAAPTAPAQTLANALLDAIREGLELCVAKAPSTQLDSAVTAINNAEAALEDYLDSPS